MATSATRVSDAEKTFHFLHQRFITRTGTVGIIGLGYVGLPLAVAFAEAGFSVCGLDANAERVGGVQQGASYIPDVSSDALRRLVKERKLQATTDQQQLRDCDAVIICVPTPLRKTREPDISYIATAAEQVESHLHAGQLIVLESTTYPGTTEEMLQPMMERKGLAVGRDVFLAFSPERVDPGNQQFTTTTIPKVVGGVTAQCTELARTLYGQIIPQVIPVSSPKTAEMVKLLENTFRAVNIGLANEMALMCDKLGVNVWEVIEAANTKPFGFMAFYPGPGIGGHCIPSDPIYLSWKARMHGYEARMIELAAQINAYMPHHVADKVAQALNTQKKPLNGSRILLFGLAYKKDVSDMRDSPAFDVAQALAERGARVAYHDPYVPVAQLNGREARSTALNASVLQQTDCVVILTNHTRVDYDLILQHAPLIVDTRNQYRQAREGRDRVITL